MAIVNDPEILDATSVDENIKYEIQQLSDFIRHKKYGKDVRESIAQGLERAYELVDIGATPVNLIGVETVPASDNWFNKIDILTGGYYSPVNGAWTADAAIDSSNFIDVSGALSFKYNSDTSHVEWDANKQFIRGGFGIVNRTLETKYVTFGFGKTAIDTTQFMDISKWTDTYVPFVAGYKLTDKWDLSQAVGSIDRGAIDGFKIANVLKSSSSANLFDPNDTLNGGYYEITNNGAWVTDAAYSTSMFIPVAPNARYKKSNGLAYAKWDKDVNFLGGAGATDDVYTDSQTRYVTISFPAADAATTKMMAYDEWTEDYVAYESGYLLGDKWQIDSTMSDAATAESKSLHLRVPSPYSDGTSDAWANSQVTHPSIVQFATAWNGYKYWMACTPYPHGQVAYENPIVVASNDGIKWASPTGIPTPLEPQPAGGYNSDSEIFMNSTTGKMEVWWRAVVGDDEILRRRTSLDGITWSATETMLTVAGNGMQVISPAIIWDGSKYVMWFNRDFYLMRMTSTNGFVWTAATNVKAGGSNIHTWHSNVILLDNVYYLLNCDKADVVGAGGVIKASTSADGLDFTAEQTIIEPSGYEWDLDGAGVYRAALIKKTDYFMLTYGAYSHTGDWTLLVQTGKDIYNLAAIDQKAFDFYNVD